MDLVSLIVIQSRQVFRKCCDLFVPIPQLYRMQMALSPNKLFPMLKVTFPLFYYLSS